MKSRSALPVTIVLLTACTPAKHGGSGPNLSPAGNPMRTCLSSDVANGQPQRAIKIVIPDLNPQHQPIVNQYPADTGHPHGDTSKPPIPMPPNEAGQSAYDLNISLRGSPSANNAHDVYLDITINDPNVTFYVDDPTNTTDKFQYAITPFGKNSGMFCRVKNSDFSAREVIFVVTFDPEDSSVSRRTHGHFNINFSTPTAKAKLAVPISIDPDIENDG